MDSRISPASLALADIEEDAFLAGPERHAAWLDAGEITDLLDVDDVFGKTMQQLEFDVTYGNQGALDPKPEALDTNSRICRGYRYCQVEVGVLLLDQNGDIAGGYLGVDIVVADKHRGRGLGAELVLERYLRDGTLPNWDLDDACYTFAGEAAHRAAWRLLQDPTFFAEKIVDIEIGAVTTEISEPAIRVAA